MTGDEAHAARIIDHYRRHGRAWAADRGAHLIEGAWLDRFLSVMPPGARVLDLGCGPGATVARYLARKGCVLIGVDTSPAMLSLFAAELPAHEAIEADMRGLDLGRVFDGVLAWDSFFHLTHDDQRAMFGVFAAHAAPGAALMFTSGPSHGIAMGSYAGEPLFHASLDPAEYRSLLASNGFDVVRFEPDDPGCGGHTVWLARRR